MGWRSQPLRQRRQGARRLAGPRLLHAPTPLAWSEWRYVWAAAASGAVALIARATDNERSQQPLSPSRALRPDSGLDGSWAVHRVQAIVKK